MIVSTISLGPFTSSKAMIQAATKMRFSPGSLSLSSHRNDISDADRRRLFSQCFSEEAVKL